MNTRAIASALLSALGVTLALAALGEQLADVSETAETFQPTTESQPLALASSAISISEPTPYGTRFNLEPRANAQSQQSSDIDFLPNWIAPGVDLVVGVASDQRRLVGGLGGSVSGYYVSRDADKSPEYEGGLPPIVDPRDGAQLVGGGIPVVAADPIRGAVFAADLRSRKHQRDRFIPSAGREAAGCDSLPERYPHRRAGGHLLAHQAAGLRALERVRRRLLPAR